MKKIYNSPELEIVKFTVMEAIADSFGNSPFSQDDGDIFETEGDDIN